MTILTLRSDKPEAELGLYNDGQQLAYTAWEAHRQLAETVHSKLDELLGSQRLGLHDIQGIVAYKGPGSFTGLRIGLSVANALADALNVPIIGTQTDEWIQLGITQLLKSANDRVILPEYGSPPHITDPRK